MDIILLLYIYNIYLNFALFIDIAPNIAYEFMAI